MADLDQQRSHLSDFVTDDARKRQPWECGKRRSLASAVLIDQGMNAKVLFKGVLLTALLVLVLLLSWHNRATVDFNLLPMWNQSFHGPVALMGFVFLGVGMLMGVVMSIRTARKQKASPEAPDPIPRISVPRIETSEPPVGSRIS